MYVHPYVAVLHALLQSDGVHPLQPEGAQNDEQIYWRFAKGRLMAKMIMNNKGTLIFI